jgi:hypothetical protein
MRSPWRGSRLTGVRNAAILIGLATAFSFLGDGLSLTSELVGSLVRIAFFVGLLIIGIQYFKDNQLKWYVIKRPLRIVVIVCAAAIGVLLLVGPLLLGNVMSSGAMWALVLVLGLVIAWIVVQSRRY